MSCQYVQEQLYIRWFFSSFCQTGSTFVIETDDIIHCIVGDNMATIWSCKFKMSADNSSEWNNRTNPCQHIAGQSNVPLQQPNQFSCHVWRHPAHDNIVPICIWSRIDALAYPSPLHRQQRFLPSAKNLNSSSVNMCNAIGAQPSLVLPSMPQS